MSGENGVDKEVCNVKHDGLDARMEDLDGDVKKVDKDVNDLKVSINKNMERLYDKIETFASRPSWTVAVMISSLLSLSVGLIVKLAVG